RRPVHDRVGERDPHLDGVGAGGGARLDHPLPAGEAAGHVGDEQLAPPVAGGAQPGLEPADGGLDLAGHPATSVPERSTPRIRATWATSLSPRPDRLTRTVRPASAARSRLTSASACADSSAGMMPSVRASSWKASSTSASVTRS